MFNIMTKYRLFNKYIMFVFLILLLGLFIEMFVESGIYQVIPSQFEKYYHEETLGMSKEEKAEFRKRTISNLVDYDLYAELPSMIFNFLLPVLCCVTVVVFIKEKNGVFIYKFTRGKKRIRVVLSAMLANAAITALALYLAYLIYCIMGIPFLKMQSDNIHEALDFLFGKGFGNKNLPLYYCLVGLVQVFAFSFVYNLFSCSVALITKKIYLPIVVPVVYFIGGNFLFYSPGIRIIGEKLAPAFTVSINGYFNTTAAEACVPLLFPLIISIIMCIFVLKSKERT